MSWSIRSAELTQAELLNNESIFALGNGYIGVRGNFEEGYAPGMNSIRGTYLNAFHDVITIPYGEKLHGFPGTQQKLVNGIDAQSVTILVGDKREPFSLFTGTVRSFERALNMDAGSAVRSVHWVSPEGQELKVSFTRLVSFAVRELFAIHIEIEPISVQGPITIVSTINGDVENYTAANDPRVASGHAKLLRTVSSGTAQDVDYVVDETSASGLRMSCATAYSHSDAIAVERAADERSVMYTARFDGGRPLFFTKRNIYTDTLRHGADPLSAGLRIASEAASAPFSEQLARQRAYVADFWKRSDIVIGDDARLQEGIRFNLYQLLQSAGQDAHSNIAAKGLTGEGYEGHYFWDTEIYMFPVFLMTQPAIAKQLLIYRHGILDFARARAREMGHKQGALYPWRTISGTECSSFFPSGTAQYHISADIAYSYSQYYMATEDNDFLWQYGAEVLIETARLWIEIGHYYDGAFHIDEVTGPDEYTCCVDNNYYTNAMAKHNLRWAARSCRTLSRLDADRFGALAEKLGVTEEEILGWDRAAEAMLLPYDEALDINPQDDTFLRKQVWDFDNTPEEHYPLLLHYHPLTIYRYQVCKQADTVLAHFLLEDEQRLDTIRSSYDYYEKITTHDSSLSTCIFSIMASKVGYAEKAYDYFKETARLDLDNTHGNTKDGLHLANMGGTWMAIVFGFAGVRIKDTHLALAPAIPAAWDRYEFKIQYKGRTIDVRITKAEAQLTLSEGDALQVRLYDRDIALEPGKAYVQAIQS
ncbi:glycoside hydrolase family 65 protein [Paenibacillus antri]|uniref:Glycoside hydrolase family 65 protein n=1 Tax=Paenibacillus antri TaxID=2582848 RepID=A0A5R9G019_9BACL|nr:glycosyl hydrolase family 65 protein [Paenibacillus antri]TLS49111.1 glycoside hydrolase family 65 protein [Paenibacillus antri]